MKKVYSKTQGTNLSPRMSKSHMMHSGIYSFAMKSSIYRKKVGSFPTPLDDMQPWFTTAVEPSQSPCLPWGTWHGEIWASGETLKRVNLSFCPGDEYIRYINAASFFKIECVSLGTEHKYSMIGCYSATSWIFSLVANAFSWLDRFVSHSQLIAGMLTRL